MALPVGYFRFPCSNGTMQGGGGLRLIYSSAGNNAPHAGGRELGNLMKQFGAL
jgi:hypothetical protein